MMWMETVKENVDDYDDEDNNDDNELKKRVKQYLSMPLTEQRK